MLGDGWYYVDGAARSGPVAAVEIRRLIGEDRLTPSSMVWRDGMSDWQRADAHFDFPSKDAGNGPPPLPPVAPLPGDSGRSGAGHAAETAHAGGGTTGPDGLYIHAPARGFGEAITVCLQKYATFSGRASRSEYWFFFAFPVFSGWGYGNFRCPLFRHRRMGRCQPADLDRLFGHVASGNGSRVAAAA